MVESTSSASEEVDLEYAEQNEVSLSVKSSLYKS